MKYFKKGAEAELTKKDFFGEKALEKKRISKTYRDKELDEKIVSGRTKKEAKFLKKARQKVKTPKVLEVIPEEKTITMEYLEGETAKKRFKKGDIEDAENIGKAIKRLHDINIIHNDLTTSNIILKNKEPHFIDFGLSFRSSSTEDKATDLVVYEKMLRSTHFKRSDKIWERTLEGYSPDQRIIDQMNRIKERVRYGK